MDKRHGGCHCGALKFEVVGPLRDVIFCHCTQCRKQTGNYVGATRVDGDRITIEGAENLTWYAASDEAKRGFCSICGSALFWKSVGSDGISIMAGAFDNPTGLKAQSHIFVADKGDYYAICDGLPQYPGND